MNTGSFTEGISYVEIEDRKTESTAKAVICFAIGYALMWLVCIVGLIIFVPAKLLATARLTS